jgi:uncharacterized SAM-binding protein YcdF (DUF218 family)
MAGMSQGRRWHVWIRRGIGLVTLVGLGLALWAGADLIYVSTDNETDYAAPADVILVLGCPSYEGNVPGPSFSACVQGRAHHAADLYKRGLAAHVITTGGLTGPAPSEAAALATVLKDDGVPAAAIVLEEQARDTIQNIQFSRAVMRAQGWHTAILVTEPNHIKRATLIAHDGGLIVFPSPAVATAGWQTPAARRDNLLRDARTLMDYQIRRLTGEQI